MFKQDLDVNSFYAAIKNFKDLGDGRKKKRVLIGRDSEDARTAKLFFAGYIMQNWPSWKQITITSNGKTVMTFNTETKTVDWKLAYIFLWNDLTADLWFLQTARQKLLKWLETASQEDFLGMSQLILEETASEHEIWNDPRWVFLSYWQVQVEIQKLSLPALRRLNSLTEIDRKVQAGKAA